jgi:hypothetical protein
MQKNLSWQTPTTLLVLMSIAMPLAFNTWSALLNNFAVERAAFSGVEIGILQSLREVPGFLSFTVIFVLLIIKEQTFAVISLALLGLGVAMTGFFPTEYGLYFTTVLMSTGFHYFEAIKQSLSLQWLSKEEGTAGVRTAHRCGGYDVLDCLWRALGTARSIRSQLSLELRIGRWTVLCACCCHMAGLPSFSCKDRTA